MYDYSLNFVLERITEGEDYGVNEIYVFVNGMLTLIQGRSVKHSWKIFRFVDHNNFLVPVGSEEGQTVFENKYLVVQCKPTALDIKVYLFLGDIEVIKLTEAQFLNN